TFTSVAQMTFTAKIENRVSDTITIRGAQKFIKKIAVDNKGIFTDTFEVTTGFYQFFDGSEYTQLYLKNGYDLLMTLNTKEFDESIAYKGNGSLENNVLAKKALDDEQFELKHFTTDDETAFQNAFDTKKASDAKLLSDEKLDENFRTVMTKRASQEYGMVVEMRESAMAAKKMVGKPSPTFTYENHKGGTSTLADFKGKYVYIDVWATWCGPCLAEIPHLKKVEAAYHGKNIVFLSISIDAKKDYEKWKNMVNQKQLGGVQLIADNDWNSKFVTDYGIQGIPRFILIDPNGNVVEADASRPSSPDLLKKLDALLK
nr:TlpA family protein disulfide reductase [Flavobacterium sp.]